MKNRCMKAVKINEEFFCYGDKIKITHRVFDGVRVGNVKIPASIIKESIGELRGIDEGYYEDSIVLDSDFGIESIGIARVESIGKIG
ncbi:hypothetical protein ACSW9O_15320 (plasmid) [Clostridium perfringens]